jgi:tetratricopeptide (TPR) repeat protein
VIEPLLEAERAMDVGLLDQAERLYRTIAETDPRNSIAVVGLARVAIERGDDLEALRLGRRALRIDPENVMAQRVVARLEEVLTVRGIPLPPDEAAAPAPPSQPAVPTSPPASSPPASVPGPSRRSLVSRILRRGE